MPASQARAASLRPQPATRSSQSGIAIAKGPLVEVVKSDERHIVETLACGHTINNGAPLGVWANRPARRRRCYKCKDLVS